MNTDNQESCHQDRVGDQLRQARQEQNRTIEDVAAHTRISPASLRAMENSAYKQLPADSFTKGLLLIYAEYLGLDGRALVDQFFLERDGELVCQPTALQKSRITHSLEPKKLAEQARISSATAAMALLLCIVVSLTGFCLYYSWNPFSYLTDKLHQVSTTVKSTFHPADPATSGIQNQNTLILQAVFLRDCRVVVSLDDHPGAEQNYLKGSTIQWEAQQALVLSFHQDNCAELHFNGDSLPFPPVIDGRATLRLPFPANAP